MKFSSTLFILAAAASSVLAVPIKRDNVPTEKDILQFALTLEHLETTFYTQALQQFDEQAFVDAGFSSDIFGRFQQIQEHEATHVEFLTAAIGPDAVQACTYNFPYNDVPSFIALSSIFEGVGVSAYTGAAHFLVSDDAITAAGAILSTEARQQAWVKSDVQKQNPWSGNFDTPLTLNEVFSLAAPFIVSCPSTNAALPVSAFPALTVSPSTPSAGQTITLAFDCGSNTSTLYVAFFSGLSTTFVEINDDKSVTIPANLQGTVYAVVTTVSTGTVTDSNTIAGPVILDFGLSPSAPQ